MVSIFKDISDKNLVNEVDIKEKQKENVNGTVYVKDGKIIVNDPIGEGKPAKIIPNPKVTIYIDNEEVKEEKYIYSKNYISYTILPTEASRKIKIRRIRNNMQALISVHYKPKIEYNLKNTEESNELRARIVEYKSINPPLYTIDEIKKSIADVGIVYGIKSEVLQYMCSSYEVDASVFAEGKKPIEYTEDKLDVKFKKGPPGYKEDLKGTIDYKAIGHIVSVEAGEVLAEIIKGEEGSDGINVNGKIIKVKRPRKLRVVAGPGTEQYDNEIKSSIKGKPLYVGGKISVTSLHEIRGNVDLSTGNVKFSGQVIIFGSVLDGMVVEGIQGVEIYKSVSNANILSNGDINIEGNALMSDITAGGMENTNSEIREKINYISSKLKLLYDDCKTINNKSELGYDVRCGEVVKILLEKKYKDLTVKIKEFLNLYLECEERDNRLIVKLKCRMLGGGPLTIESPNVIFDLINALNIESKKLQSQNLLEADIRLSYCQDCVLRSTGNVYIYGRGDYQSNIKTNDGVYFSGMKSVTRGGKIEARKIIKCNSVGSDAGVKTELKVNNGGEIFVNFAYPNTKFVIGNYEYTLEEPCKNIHVYLDSESRLKIDKFKA